MGISYMTQEGYDKIMADLDQLKSVERAQIAKEISEARDKGDLSENAEYHAAKDAQGLLEAKINKLELQLADSKIIDESNIDTSQVSVLTTVTIKNKKNNKQVAYKLVSEAEADLKQKKISVTSPIGSGLLGKKVGEIAEVTVPTGIIEFEIISIDI